jgi:hypothetical protein
LPEGVVAEWCAGRGAAGEEFKQGVLGGEAVDGVVALDEEGGDFLSREAVGEAVKQRRRGVGGGLIASSCRSTRISSSFDPGDRQQSTISSNRRRTTKYASDHNTRDFQQTGNPTLPRHSLSMWGAQTRFGLQIHGFAPFRLVDDTAAW